MMRTTVGVLRGGTSQEYDLSLKTGAALIAALPEEMYDVRDIFIDKLGMWHVRGMPMAPARALQQVDVVLSGLHGGIGEDGTVQRILEQVGVPYAGARHLPAAISLNKAKARELLREHGIVMPHAVTLYRHNKLTTGEMARAVFSAFGAPYIVKPATEGASAGIRVARTVIELPDAIGDVLDAYGTAVVEEFLLGPEATVGVIDDFRKEPFYVLPPAEVIKPEGDTHVSFAAHVGGLLKHLVPASFSHGQKTALADVARKAHQALGLSHISRSDFILTRRGPVLLEVNALPGLYENAAFPAMLSAVGSSVGELAEHLITLARLHR